MVQVHSDLITDREVALWFLGWHARNVPFHEAHFSRTRAAIKQKGGCQPTASRQIGNYVGFALLQTVRDLLTLVILTDFRVDTNSFVAGALAATLAFFVAFSELIKLFFSIVINQVLL